MQQTRLTIMMVNRIIMKTEGSPLLFNSMASIFKTLQLYDSLGIDVLKLIVVLYNFYVTSYLKHRVMNVFSKFESIFMKI